MYPRELVIVKGLPAMVPKYAFLAKPCWHMVHGSTAMSLHENWERLQVLAKKDAFYPCEPISKEMYVSNEEGAEILEHMKLRKFTKVMHTETEIE